MTQPINAQIISLRYAQTNIHLFEQLVRLGYGETDLARISRAYDLASRLFSGRFRSVGTPHINHLVATASIVAAHGASTCTVAAALLHAAYFGGDFGTPRHGISRAKREICRRAIGAGAEHLVALFSSPAWLGVPTASICRRVGELNQEEREVALLRIANVLDQIELFILCREEQRRPHLEELTECIDLAERLGALTLAVEVRQCREQLQSLGDLSAVPLDGRDYAGFLPPLSYRPGLRVRVFDVLRFAWRLLPRRLRDAARRPPATETASTVSFVVGSDRGVRRGNRAPGRIGP